MPQLRAAGENLSYRGRWALGLAGALVISLLLSACGDSGSSDEDLAKARKEGASHVHKEERLRKLEKELKHLKKGESPPPSVLPSSSSTSTALAPSSSPSTCGGELSVGPVTTCPFAENVQDAYYSDIGSGSGTVDVYSPVTERFYTMYCTASPHECTGGNDASVYFP